MALSRDAILKHAGSMNQAEVHIPEWADETGDDVVVVRGLTSREWDTHLIAVQEAESGKISNASAELLVKCVLDEHGARVFSDADAAQVGELSVGSVSRLASKVLGLSGITADDQKVIEGNSGAAPSGSSDSGSPNGSARPSKSLKTA